MKKLFLYLAILFFSNQCFCQEGINPYKNAIGIGNFGLNYKRYFKHTALELMAGGGWNGYYGFQPSSRLNFYYRSKLNCDGFLQWYVGGGAKVIYRPSYYSKFNFGPDFVIGIEKFSRKNRLAWSTGIEQYIRLTNLTDHRFFIRPIQLFITIKYRF